MQTQISHSHFNKGDPVEATHPNHPDHRFYPASVLRAPDMRNNLVLLEYHTLFSPSDSDSDPHPHPKRLRHHLHVDSVRPKLPDQLNPWFKVGDSVDAYRKTDDGEGGEAWCPGVVADILEHSRYAVSFHEEGRAVVEQCRLRLHRDWVDGNWVPPLPQKEQQPETVMKPGNFRFKIKYSRKRLQGLMFEKGIIVEVSNNDEGYKGAWFIATIVDLTGKDRYLVEYRDLIADDESQLLKEEVDARFIRPCPPEVTFVGSFKQFQEVDVWYNDGWWEGVVLEVVNSGECSVSFINNEVLKFENSKLRPHQDWFDGKWVVSSKKPRELEKKFGDVMSKAKNLTGNKLILKYLKSREIAEKPRYVTTRTKETRSKPVPHFRKGAKVEVRSDEEGYQGAWYTAIVVDSLQNGKCLVEYLTLKTDDLSEQLKEEADATDIRPFPPDIDNCDRFALRQWVDAWYNDGWWVGQVSSVLCGFKYRVYFWPTKEELEFEHCHLRPHQEWIDGRWVHASLGWRPDQL